VDDFPDPVGKLVVVRHSGSMARDADGRRVTLPVPSGYR
jgi:hypothetical protein